MYEHTNQPNQPADTARISPSLIVVGVLATNCWLYPLEKKEEKAEKIESHPDSLEPRKPCAVIDPGADPELIIARMERLHLYPTYILLTHGHFDHLAALPGLFSYFPCFSSSSPGSPSSDALEIAIHREDAPYLGPDAYTVHRTAFSAAAGAGTYVDELWEPMPRPTKLLAEGDTIGPFTVLHLPGHTPGSVGFYDAQMQVLFSGDTLFKQGMGRTDLPGGDWDALRKSLERLFALDGAIAVYPGHGPETTIAAER
ncbi:MAG: MBL fold metallo-hydrolase [Treponema sp.]|jgi:glyoxylase-like metal-dependent hydrolase (beta-lactamase superfamily II)|nr:MBL fold metallo-hydrolase [Treponema sp.]